MDVARKIRFPLSPKVTEALTRFGANLQDIRRSQRIPMDRAAERASISRSTLYKVERGDPGVGLGIYATVLASYGLLDRLEGLALARWDRSYLPRRIRTPSVCIACLITSGAMVSSLAAQAPARVDTGVAAPMSTVPWVVLPVVGWHSPCPSPGGP